MKIYKIPDKDMQEFIVNSNNIEGIYNVKADMEYFKAWVFLRGCRELSHLIIGRTQQMITNHQRELDRIHKGNYRRINVTVGGRYCPEPALVRPLMEDWLADVVKGEKSAKELHIQFEMIHPFVDGNGRTGRLLMWWIESRRGLAPTFIPNDFKEDYYAWFNNVPS